MIFKFDILFHKNLKNGTEKVVTYSSILRDPHIFGEGETLEGSIGELSLVKEGSDQGLSIHTLLAKYRSQLVGQKLSTKFRQEFPLCFKFNGGDDPTNIHIEVTEEDGIVLTYHLHNDSSFDSSKMMIYIDEIGEAFIIPANSNEVKIPVDKIGVFEL